MADSFGGSGGGGVKAQGVADALNRQLFELILASRTQLEGGPKDHWDLGIIGYGDRVGSAFQGELEQAAGAELVSITKIWDRPVRIEERDRLDGAGGVTKFKMPIWVDPVSENGTPMAEAFDEAAKLLGPWVAAHADSLPPIVLNLTDGEPNDMSRAKTSASALTKLATSEGPVLLFNCHISSRSEKPILFPADPSGLPDDIARFLFGISSVIPEEMLAKGRDAGFVLADNARGYVFNADLVGVIKFLNIGTVLLG
jgi:hypothetical protein